jgi:hypothetical protein
MWPLPARIWGVLRSPRRTFEALATTPRSAGVLAVAAAAAFAARALVLETETGELALLDGLARTASAVGARVDDARYAALQEMSGHGSAYALVTAIVGGPLLALGVSGALFAWGRTRGLTTTYRQVMAIASHAGVILALRQVIGAPLTYARETMASPLTLNLFVVVADEGSPLVRFTGMIDLFVIWWIVVLAIGMSVLSHRRVGPLATALAGAYVLLAVLAALVTAITGGAA